MTKLKFTKMHGLGNDFVVIDCLKDGCPDFRPLAQQIADRRFGVGCDQILAIHPSDQADYRMEIINADGGEVEMCGNGIRCIAKYLQCYHDISSENLTIETLGGIMRPRIKGDLVEVDMGEPILEGKKIPTTLDGMILNHPLKVGEEEYSITCVSMGNPHCVIFVDQVEEFPVTTLGPKIENDSLFPNRINVEFVQVINPTHLRMRVWERGAGETLACGTGACATLVAAVMTGHSQREAKLHLKGGILEIRWSEKDNHVYMTGPGEEVFKGELELSL